MSAGIRGFYNDSASSLSTGQEGDIRSTAARALHVNLRDPSGAYVAPGGGTTDETAWTAGASSFSPVGGAFNDSAAALSSGQQGTARATTNRALHVNIRDHLGNEATLTGNSLNVNVTNGAAGGTSMADKAAFTVGTTNGTPAFGLVRTDVPDLVVDATGASFASTLRRGLHVNLRTQAGVELLGQQLMAASIPVALASNQSALAVTGTFWQATQPVSGTFWQATQPVSGTVTTTPPANASTNIAQINGITPLMGNGLTGTGSLRVTIASDNTAFSVNAVQSGTWNIGTVTSLTQFNGVAIALNTGVRAAGVLRVSICTDDIVAASQSGTWNIGTVTTVTTVSTVTALTTLTGGGVANASADSGNPVKVGGVYTSAPATALTTGNRGNLSVGSQNELIVQGLAPVSWFGVQATTITASVAETTIVTAGAAGVFNDLCLLTITNSSATAVTCTLKDATAGTTRGIFAIAANGGIVIPWHHRLAQAAAAANWTITSSGSVTSLFVHAHFVTRK